MCQRTLRPTQTYRLLLLFEEGHSRSCILNAAPRMPNATCSRPLCSSNGTREQHTTYLSVDRFTSSSAFVTTTHRRLVIAVAWYIERSLPRQPLHSEKRAAIASGFSTTRWLFSLHDTIARRISSAWPRSDLSRYTLIYPVLVPVRSMLPQLSVLFGAAGDAMVLRPMNNRRAVIFRIHSIHTGVTNKVLSTRG